MAGTALDPAFGSEFRRSAGLTGKRATDAGPTRQWWTATMEHVLGLHSRAPKRRLRRPQA